MVLAEGKRGFHKRKAIDALDRMKNAVEENNVCDINHQHDIFDHHIDEMKRTLLDGKEESS